jgi:hypothetical protein
MRILVCGGRDFVDVPLLWRVLDRLDEDSGPQGVRLVIEGASDDVTGPYKGADYWAHQWALARGKPTIRQHADWKQYGKAAGPRRNGVMLKEHKPAWLVAFPGGRGTSDMITKAQAAGIHVQMVTG